MKFHITKDSLVALHAAVKGFMVADTMVPGFNLVEIIASAKNQNLQVCAQTADGGIRRLIPARVEEKGSVRLVHDHVRLLLSPEHGDLVMWTSPKDPTTVTVRAGANIMLKAKTRVEDEITTFPAPVAKNPQALTTESMDVDRVRWREVATRVAVLSANPKNSGLGRPNISAVNCHRAWTEASDGTLLLRLPWALLGGHEALVPGRMWPTIFSLLADGEGQVRARIIDGRYLWLMSADGWAAFFRLEDQPFPDTSRMIMVADAVDGRADVGAFGTGPAVMVQTWAMTLNADRLVRAARLAARAWSKGSGVEQPQVTVGFQVTKHGVMMALDHPSVTSVEVRMADASAVPSADAARALERVHLSVVRLEKIIDSGLHGHELVDFRWTEKLHERVQLECADGTRAMVAQMRD